MKKVNSTVFALLLIFNINLFSQTLKPVTNYVFLLDTSTSMIGIPTDPKNIDILDDVKKEINNFIEEIEPPANVLIYEFDAGIQSSNKFEINSKHDLDKAKNHILKIKATGRTTYIYRSLEDILQRMNNYIERHAEEEHTIIIQLFTDGNDKDKPPYTMERVMDYFQQIKKEGNWWIFYTTLGVELPEIDKEIIDEHPEVKHIHNKDGVHPIQIIENKISNLHFGNLWQNSTSSQTALFKLPIKKKLPENITISVNEEFSNFPDGLGVIVNPDNFIPQKTVDFDIEIVGFSQEKKECEGLHEFKINLVSPDPFVQIVPDYIDAKFLYEPPRLVEISPLRNEKFPVNFGELNTNKNAEVIVEKKINLLFNNQAVAKGGDIKVNWEIEKGPTELNSNNIIINNSKEKYVIISTNSKEMIIKIIANKDLKPGKYKGKINFISEDITISGEELKENKENQNIQYIMWSFEIPSKPIPFYNWIITILVIGIVMYIIYKMLTKPPVFKDLNLQVIKPCPENISLSKKNVVTFGVNGDYLTHINANFLIRTEKIGNRIYAVLEVFQGTIKLTKSDDNIENVIYSEERIFDGDIITFEDYKIEFSSYSLMRD